MPRKNRHFSPKNAALGSDCRRPACQQGRSFPAKCPPSASNLASDHPLSGKAVTAGKAA